MTEHAWTHLYYFNLLNLDINTLSSILCQWTQIEFYILSMSRSKNQNICYQNICIPRLDLYTWNLQPKMVVIINELIYVDCKICNCHKIKSSSFACRTLQAIRPVWNRGSQSYFSLDFYCCHQHRRTEQEIWFLRWLIPLVSFWN